MKRGRKKRSWRGRIVRWVVGLVLVLAGVTALPVLLLRWCDPPISAFMLQAKWAADEKGYRTWYEWVDYASISPELVLAVIAAEDQRFPLHAGFDLDSIRRAIEDSVDGRRLRGASTLTQQVAKNLFLWPGRSLVRKGLEAWFTVLIEVLWSKRRILEVYLNIAEFGPGTYGAQAAARRYFGKPAAQLDAAQAALLAAVLPSPRRLRVERPSPYVRARQEWIMAQMRGLGGRAYLRRLQQ